jgi:hypothetical protein
MLDTTDRRNIGNGRFDKAPRGRKGERRPADVNGNAAEIMRIATGEQQEDYGPEATKDQAAAAWP